MRATKHSLTENILRMPKQFDTIIGERGVTLIGWSKAKNCHRKGFYKRFAELLIFDDSLSALRYQDRNKHILENIYNQKQRQNHHHH
jgi:ABC-type multidrug transport system fused ATPase/permease subunit